MAKKDKRIFYNLTSGIGYQFVLIAMGLLLPRLYLDNFGSEVNGILGTIKQIFTYMCLLEAGIGQATAQALLHPVGTNDYGRISRILSATQRHYTKTGFFYIAVVLVIAAVFAYRVAGVIAPGVLFTLIILNALPSLFNYFVQAKYRLLMEADGRVYIISTSEMIMQVLANLGKILVLLFTQNLILIQLVYCVLAVMQMAYVYIRAKRIYKALDLKAEPDEASIAQKSSVLVHQLSAIVFNNTDILLLSAMRGFAVASVYSIYNFFFTQMQAVITGITSSFRHALGQQFQRYKNKEKSQSVEALEATDAEYVSDKAKFMQQFNVYETFYIMGTFLIYTLMAVFLLPLVQIYTTGIEDIEYANSGLVLLFVLMNLLSNGKLPANHLLEFDGMFRDTRSHAIIEMCINLAVSVAAIYFWGICGALCGTIVALMYRGSMMIYYANRKVLARSVMHTYKLWIVNGAVFVLVMAIFYVDTYDGYGFLELLVQGIIHSVWILALYIAVNFVFCRRAFYDALAMLGRKVK